MAMGIDEELFLNQIDAYSGTEGDFYLLSEEGVVPPVYSVIYRDIPESGFTTTVTCGLSSIDYHEWTHARPELTISVNSTDLHWGWAIGDIAAKSRGHHGFHLGATVNFNARISEESEMSAFLISPPGTLSREQSNIDLPNRKITIMQMIPIYDGEMLRIREEGLEWFLKQDFDITDVRRLDTSK